MGPSVVHDTPYLICEAALQARWQTRIIITVQQTDGESLRAPLLEFDRTADVHSTLLVGRSQAT